MSDPQWKPTTLGSNESLDLVFFKIGIIFRHGTKDNPIPKTEKYEFTINGLTSNKKFATSEEAKKIALSSALNRLTAATEIVKTMIGDKTSHE